MSLTDTLQIEMYAYAGLTADGEPYTLTIVMPNCPSGADEIAKHFARELFGSDEQLQYCCFEKIRSNFRLGDDEFDVRVDLNPTIDIYGNTLAAGDRVRSFDSDRYEYDDPRANYAEGYLESIGEIEKEGCPRYKIWVVDRRWGGKHEQPHPEEFYVYPPVNGCIGSLSGQPTFGVIKIADPHA